VEEEDEVKLTSRYIGRERLFGDVGRATTEGGGRPRTRNCGGQFSCGKHRSSSSASSGSQFTQASGSSDFRLGGVGRERSRVASTLCPVPGAQPTNSRGMSGYDSTAIMIRKKPAFLASVLDRPIGAALEPLVGLHEVVQVQQIKLTVNHDAKKNIEEQ